MKGILLAALIVCQGAFAAKPNEWVPKYKKNKQAAVKKSLKNPSKNKIKKTKIVPANKLEALYLKDPKGKDDVEKLKNASLKMKQEAVPTLIKVMKSSDFPDKNRWVATYMLGRIMGKKSAEFISKFSQHPNWMLRLASLKVLLHLDQKQYKGIYARMLEDKSLIVRHQALQNIKEMKLKGLAPYVWKMLYNKENYVGLKGERKRSHIIKAAIKVVGDLKFKDAKMPMLKMMQKKRYSDVHEELDYALSHIEGKASPKGNLAVKRHYWNKIALKSFTL